MLDTLVNDISEKKCWTHNPRPCPGGNCLTLVFDTFWKDPVMYTAIQLDYRVIGTHVIENSVSGFIGFKSCCLHCTLMFVQFYAQLYGPY